MNSKAATHYNTLQHTATHFRHEGEILKLKAASEVRQEKSRVKARATEEARFEGDNQLVQMQAQMYLQSKEAQLQAQAKEAELQRVRYA